MRDLLRLWPSAISVMMLLGSSAHADSLFGRGSNDLGDHGLAIRGNGYGEFTSCPPNPLKRFTTGGTESDGIPGSFPSVLTLASEIGASEINSFSVDPFARPPGSLPGSATLSASLLRGTIDMGADVLATTRGLRLTGQAFTGRDGIDTGAAPAGTDNRASPGDGILKELARKVPEPASLGLLGIGLSGLITLRRFLRRLKMA